MHNQDASGGPYLDTFHGASSQDRHEIQHPRKRARIETQCVERAEAVASGIPTTTSSDVSSNKSSPRLADSLLPSLTRRQAGQNLVKFHLDKASAEHSTGLHANGSQSVSSAHVLHRPSSHAASTLLQALHNTRTLQLNEAELRGAPELARFRPQQNEALVNPLSQLQFTHPADYWRAMPAHGAHAGHPGLGMGVMAGEPTHGPQQSRVMAPEPMHEAAHHLSGLPPNMPNNPLPAHYLMQLLKMNAAKHQTAHTPHEQTQQQMAPLNSQQERLAMQQLMSAYQPTTPAQFLPQMALQQVAVEAANAAHQQQMMSSSSVVEARAIKQEEWAGVVSTALNGAEIPPPHIKAISNQISASAEGSMANCQVIEGTASDMLLRQSMNCETRVRCARLGRVGRFSSQKLWIKYGQKKVQRCSPSDEGVMMRVGCVKRSYYKCYNKKCPAKMYVDVDENTGNTSPAVLSDGHTHAFEIALEGEDIMLLAAMRKQNEVGHAIAATPIKAIPIANYLAISNRDALD